MTQSGHTDDTHHNNSLNSIPQYQSSFTIVKIFLSHRWLKKSPNFWQSSKKCHIVRIKVLKLEKGSYFNRIVAIFRPIITQSGHTDDTKHNNSLNIIPQKRSSFKIVKIFLGHGWLKKLPNFWWSSQKCHNVCIKVLKLEKGSYFNRIVAILGQLSPNLVTLMTLSLTTLWIAYLKSNHHLKLSKYFWATDDWKNHPIFDEVAKTATMSASKS
jgi:hypothetical protein